MQEMNVASGGSLYQDIPFQIYGQTTYEGVLQQDATNIHKNYNNRIDNENEYTFIHFHPIKILPKSFLATHTFQECILHTISHRFFIAV